MVQPRRRGRHFRLHFHCAQLGVILPCRGSLLASLLREPPPDGHLQELVLGLTQKDTLLRALGHRLAKTREQCDVKPSGSGLAHTAALTHSIRRQASQRNACFLSYFCFWRLAQVTLGPKPNPRDIGKGSECAVETPSNQNSLLGIPAVGTHLKC